MKTAFKTKLTELKSGIEKWVLRILPGLPRVTLNSRFTFLTSVLYYKGRQETSLRHTSKLTVCHVIHWPICNLEGKVTYFYQPTCYSVCAFYALTLMKGNTVFCQFSARKVSAIQLYVPLIRYNCWNELPCSANRTARFVSSACRLITFHLSVSYWLLVSLKKVYELHVIRSALWHVTVCLISNMVSVII